MPRAIGFNSWRWAETQNTDSLRTWNFDRLHFNHSGLPGHHGNFWSLRWAILYLHRVGVSIFDYDPNDA